MSATPTFMHIAVSKILHELENDLLNQVIGEIKARRALLARAVTSAEAVVRETYECRGSDACSYGIVSDSARPSDIEPSTPTTPGKTNFGNFVVSQKGHMHAVPEAYHSGDSKFSFATESKFAGLAPQQELEVAMFDSEARPLVPPSSRRPAMLRCSLDGSSDPSATTPEAAAVSLDFLIAQSAARNGGCWQEMEGGKSFADKVNSVLSEFRNPTSASPEGAAQLGFVINDLKAWTAKLTIEFLNRGINESDTVLIKDSSGFVLTEMTAKDFAADLRIPSLPPLPLNFTYIKSADGNTCTVSSLSLEGLASKMKKGVPAGLGLGHMDELQKLEATIRNRPKNSRGEKKRFSKLAKSVVAAGRLSRLAGGAPDLMLFDDDDASYCQRSEASMSECAEEKKMVAENFEFLSAWEPANANSTASEPLSPQFKKPGLERLNSFDSADSSDAATWRGTMSIASVVSSGSDPHLYVESSAQGTSRGCGCCQRFILRPTSVRCILWDCLKSLAMVYDLVVIPLSAFALPDYLALMILDIIISVVWVLDIGVTFSRGFIDEKRGVVEMEARSIALRYIGTWFFFDAFVVTIDICIILMKNAIAMHGIVKLLPMLRLIRCMKLPSLLGMLIELLGLKANTEKLAFIFRIFKLLTIFLFINHFICCGWYAIGQLGPKDENGSKEAGSERWIELFFDEEATLGYRYTTSFHWSLTQFTPAGMEVTPNNFVERLYNVMIIAVGFIMFSSFVSMMTQSISQLQQASSSERTAMRQLRRFIADNSITVETVGKIMTFIHEEKKTVRKKKLHEEDIEVLNCLPHTLRQHIRVEMYCSVLEGHSLMQKIAFSHSACFKNLCHDALCERNVMRGEALFHFGMEGSGMFFVTEGLMHYYLGYDRRVEEVVGCDRSGKLRICEASLWVRWVHRGRMIGEEPTELVLVQTSQFTKVCSHSVLVGQLKKYAMTFARRMLRQHGNPLYIKDTWGSEGDAIILVENAFGNNQIMCQFLGLSDPGSCFRAWRDIAQASKHGRRGFFQRTGTSSSSLWSRRPGKSGMFGWWKNRAF